MIVGNLLRRRAYCARPLQLPLLCHRRPESTLSSLLPKNLQPTAEELSQATITTKTISPTRTYDINSPPTNVRAPLWTLMVSTLMRMDPQRINYQPKKSVLHWMIQNAETREELDVAQDLALHWRMHMMPITQATTQIWAESCMRLEQPQVFVDMLMDRWKYRQLPINYNMAKFIRFLGATAAGDSSGNLDDAFRLFALYPFYGLKYDADAYGALIEACCMVKESEDAWRRALVVSEEALSLDPPLITLEALRVLETRSIEHGEPEMAQRYKSLAAELALKPTNTKESANFDDDGNHLVN